MSLTRLAGAGALAGGRTAALKLTVFGAPRKATHIRAFALHLTAVSAAVEQAAFRVITLHLAVAVRARMVATRSRGADVVATGPLALERTASGAASTISPAARLSTAAEEQRSHGREYEENGREVQTHDPRVSRLVEARDAEFPRRSADWQLQLFTALGTLARYAAVLQPQRPEASATGASRRQSQP